MMVTVQGAGKQGRSMRCPEPFIKTRISQEEV